MLRRPTNLVAALLLAVALSDDSLPAGFWENSGGSTGTAAKIKANGLPSDYTYSYSEAPLPPPPEPPPPPPPLPPPPPASITLCGNECASNPKFASDSFCDDGGPDASFDKCDLGTDCSDCGPRVRLARVPAMPKPPPARSPPPSPLAAAPPNAGGDVNLFGHDRRFYVSSGRRLQLVRALNGTEGGGAEAEAVRAGLLAAWEAPVAFWVDAKARVRGGAESAEAVLRDAAESQQSPAPLVVFVLHALPNRDCQRAAPGGEICCHFAAESSSADGASCDLLHSTSASDVEGDKCDVGLAEYEADIVDAFVELLAEHADRVPIAVVIEPGSLSSLSLGGSAPRCSAAATRHAYLGGVAYAVQRLSERVPGAALYLDAGDGATLGWGERVRTFVTLVAHLGELAYRLRGFATNVGSYQPLGAACPADQSASLPTYCRANPRDPCCGSDPCRLIARFNSGVGELNYVQLLARHLRIAMPGFRPHFLIDTGRNGVEDSRANCDATCNLRGAGFGALPTAQTALPEMVDAYFWLHPPGVSDGCSSANRCTRIEPACSWVDALGARPREAAAPAAGELFLPLLRRLAAQANGDAAYDRYLIEEHSPALVQAATDAVAFATLKGLPTRWAAGLAEPPSSDDTGRKKGSLVAVLALAGVAVGLASAVGAVTRWWRSSTMVEDVDGRHHPRGGRAVPVPTNDVVDEEELGYPGMDGAKRAEEEVEMVEAKEEPAPQEAPQQEETVPQMGAGGGDGVTFRCVD